MNQLLFILFLHTFILGCVSVETSPPINPVYPSLAQLNEKCLTDYELLEIVKKSDLQVTDLYYLDGQLFTGCAKRIFENTSHRYRYYQCTKGVMQRQIGYYDSYQLDHDFNLKNGLSHGSEKMWRLDGHLYIDHYYLNGKQHGLQQRWYDNDSLARRAMYDNGNVKYEFFYDKEGVVIESLSTIEQR